MEKREGLMLHLTEIRLFKGIPNQTLADLLDKVVYQVKHYQKGNVIARRNKTCKFLLILTEGAAKGEMLNASGKVINIEVLIAPRPLAPAFLFGQHNRFPVDIIATSHCSLVLFPRESVIKMIQQSDVFLKNYLDTVSNRAQFLSNKIYFLSFKTLKEKLANYLLEQSKPYRKSFQLTQTQQQLAEQFGVTRPSLARTVQELEDEGIISVQNRQVTILNPEGLAGTLG